MNKKKYNNNKIDKKIAIKKKEKNKPKSIWVIVQLNIKGWNH